MTIVPFRSSRQQTASVRSVWSKITHVRPSPVRRRVRQLVYHLSHIIDFQGSKLFFFFVFLLFHRYDFELHRLWYSDVAGAGAGGFNLSRNVFDGLFFFSSRPRSFGSPTNINNILSGTRISNVKPHRNISPATSPPRYYTLGGRHTRRTNTREIDLF